MQSAGHPLTEGKSMRRRRISLLLALAVLIAQLSGTGCAKVPPQAVVLSSTVGERIADMQASHEAFVSAYFRVSRERMEDFLTERWIPVFLGNYVREAGLMDKLETAEPFNEEDRERLVAELERAGIEGEDQRRVMQALGRALGDPQRGALMLQFSQAAIGEIERKRKSLIDPLNELERRSLDELRKSYAQLREAQSTVTGHLSSVQKVTEAQDQTLERLGLLRQRDLIIDTAIQTNEGIMGILDAGKDAATTLKELEAEVKAKLKGE